MTRKMLSGLIFVSFFGVFPNSAFSDYRSEIESYAATTGPISSVLAAFMSNFKIAYEVVNETNPPFDHKKFLETHLAEFISLDPEIEFYFELVEKAFEKDMECIRVLGDRLIIIFKDFSVLNVLLTGLTQKKMDEIKECGAVSCFFDHLVGKSMRSILSYEMVLFLQVGTDASKMTPSVSPNIKSRLDQTAAHLEFLRITRGIRRVTPSNDPEYGKVLNEFIRFLSALWV